MGANVSAGTDPEEIVEKPMFMLGSGRNWENPFGDAKAGEKTTGILRDKFD